LSFMFCLNSDFLFYTRLVLAAAALQKSKLHETFQIVEAIDSPKDVIAYPVSVFGGEDFKECLGNTLVIWNWEKIEQLPEVIGTAEFPPAYQEKYISLEIRANTTNETVIDNS